MFLTQRNKGLVHQCCDERDKVNMVQRTLAQSFLALAQDLKSLAVLSTVENFVH